jgi:hypothetical protein
MNMITPIKASIPKMMMPAILFLMTRRELSGVFKLCEMQFISHPSELLFAVI